MQRDVYKKLLIRYIGRLFVLWYYRQYNVHDQS